MNDGRSPGGDCSRAASSQAARRCGIERSYVAYSVPVGRSPFPRGPGIIGGAYEVVCRVREARRECMPDGIEIEGTADRAARRVEVRQRPRWAEIDTVLLDMDGTLLDLEFDNHFWLELIPQRYALCHALPLETARAVLKPLFASRQGTLDWYCTDFWSRELGFDVAGLKREAGGRVRFLPGAERFLQTLAQQRLCKVLVTNAHRDSLSVKAQQTGLMRYFDEAVSSHDLGLPKEDEAFWSRLQALLGFAPGRCLFVDDSPAVLQAARRYGIGQIFAVSRPDSTRAPGKVADFAAVEAVEQLLDSLPSPSA